MIEENKQKLELETGEIFIGPEHPNAKDFQITYKGKDIIKYGLYPSGIILYLHLNEENEDNN